MNNELCHCGKHLHYTDKKIEELIHKFVKESGRFVSVVDQVNKKTYKVCRHYIALHGIEWVRLAEYGFEEVK